MYFIYKDNIVIIIYNLICRGNISISCYIILSYDNYYYYTLLLLYCVIVIIIVTNVFIIVITIVNATA